MAVMTPIWQQQPLAVVSNYDTIAASVLVDSSTAGVVWDVLDSAGTSVFTTTTTPTYYSAYYNLAELSQPVASIITASGAYQLRAVASGGGETSSPALAYFEVHVAPVVTLTSPTDGATIDSLPIVIAWTVEESGRIVSQTLTITDADGGTVMRQSVEPGITSARYDDLLDNDARYTIAVSAVNAYNLGASDSASVTTLWAAPVMPGMDVADAEGLAKTVTVTFVEGGVAADSANVYRVDGEGNRVLLASGLADGGSVTDLIPPVGIVYRYEAVAFAHQTGVPSDPYVLPTSVNSTAWALNFGADGADVVTLYGNPKASSGIEHGGRAYHFADGGAGGGLPVWYGTTERDESGAVTFETVGPDYARALRRLSLQSPIAWLRDPFGNRWRAHVTPKVTHGTGELWTISIDWDAVRFREIGA